MESLQMYNDSFSFVPGARISNAGEPLSRTVRITLSLVLLSVLSACNHSGHDHDSSSSPDASIEFGDEYWASLAQNYAPFERPDPPLGAAYGAEDLQFVGSWSSVTDWPLIATGAANLPDGRVVGWSSQTPDTFTGKEENTHGTIYDPLTNSFTSTNSSSHDMFCAGVSMLEDGSVFIAGGGQTVSSTSLFSNGAFNEIDPMVLTRWYPTSTTLSSGQVLTSLGTLAAPYSERWTDGEGWDLLANVNLQNVLNEDSIAYRDWYPALNVAPDGSLFHPGHMPELFSVHLDQENSVHSHGERNGGDSARLYNTSVMYDVGKLLFAGGGDQSTTNAAYTMDINGSDPVVTTIDSMTHKRAMQNSVVLPNGEVLIIGGNTSGIQFSDEGTVLEPEMWNPETGQWRVMAPHDRPRNYHSTALLLKDGRVLATGGGLCGGCPTNHQNGETFTPPYLYDAQGELKARPQIAGGGDEAYPGDSLVLQGSDDMVRFNLLRLVAITHHHSTDQRLVPADFTKTGTGQYRLDLNSNGNVLLPGYYWVFGLDVNGTPSEGHTVQIKVAPENEAVLDNAQLPNVLYEYYEKVWAPLKLPDFDALTPVKTGEQSDFALDNKERNNHYAFRFKTRIVVPIAGEYTFFLRSDDGSRLYVDGQKIVDNDGPHALEVIEKQGKVTLSAGEHDVEVQFFEATGGDALLVSWQGPQLKKQPVNASHLVSPILSGPVAQGGTSSLVDYAYYEGDWTKLPTFEAMTPVKRGQSGGFNLNERNRDDFYGFVFSAIIDIPQSGNYTFYTTSDDGSRLSVDGTMLVNNDGLHPPVTQQGTMGLTAGRHELVVEFFERTRGDSLLVEWKGPGFNRVALPVDVLSTVGGSEAEGSATSGDTGTGGAGGEGDTDSQTGMLNYSYYEGSFLTLPDMTTLTPVKVGRSAGFDLDERLGDNNFAFNFTGKLSVPATGTYMFYTKSDDGSRVTIDGISVVTHDGVHSASEKSGSVFLLAGEHDIQVEYFERNGGEALTVSWSGPGLAKQAIPLASLSVAGSTPDAGSTTGDGAGAGNGATTDNGTGTSGDSGSGTPGTAGIHYRYFEGSWSLLPDFDALTPVGEGQSDDFALTPRTRDDDYGFSFTTYLTVPASGQYTFYTRSDDGSSLSVNDKKVVDNDGLHADRERFGKVTLAAGTHGVRVDFFEREGEDSLVVEWAGPGFGKTALSNADLQIRATDGPTEGGGSAPVAPPTSESTGLSADYHEGSYTSLPDFSTLTPLKTVIVDNLELPPSNGVTHYAYRFSGQIDIATPDTYTFYVSSNDGTQLLIDGKLVVDNDGRHAAIEKQGAVSLDAGKHSIELRYFQAGGSEALEVFWSKGGSARTRIADGLFYR